ncbi:hypothetical protein [uncultured Oscillibacter sp.]|uniref:hypothetical protein n=1 Tax=uncultured Oscillibacter sp. TaxID=876091 RepID=UPI002628E505|nr:hypothetical protein [uncultured Oscillibacter sp.]
MKNRIASFTGGFFAALALSLCLTTALAASGKVSYNFANVSMDGTQKITAGQDITAANGQKIPGSILYTDAAGGKTNYLPIRTISELLGTEIGYDSASKTVLLGKQPAAEPAPEENVIDLRTPKTVPENPRRGDVDLIKSRGGTILPDDDPNSYRGNEKMFKNKDGELWYEYLVGNDSALDDQNKKLAEQYLVNGDYPKNKKGESYGLWQLAYYVGYEPDLQKQLDGYIRAAERQAAADKLNGLSKEECPHEYTYFLYDQEGEVLREQTDPCQGHFEGMTMEEVKRAVEEGRLW